MFNNMIGKKIAIVGAQGSGKSALAYETIAELKRCNVHAGLATEGARESPYLIAGELVPEAEIDIFAKQLEAEVRALRTYEVVIADRSIFDVIMYSRLFFPNPAEQHKNYFEAMESFGKHWVSSYAAVYRMTTLYNPSLTNDPQRPRDIGLQRKAHEMLKEVLEEFGVEYEDVPSTEQARFVIERLKERGIIST